MTSTLIQSGTNSGTMARHIDAVLCRVSPLAQREHGFSSGEYFTHNAGVAGSSPAPAIRRDPLQELHLEGVSFI